jgi:hypothetical protein
MRLLLPTNTKLSDPRYHSHPPSIVPHNQELPNGRKHIDGTVADLVGGLGGGILAQSEQIHRFELSGWMVSGYFL